MSNTINSESRRRLTQRRGGTLISMIGVMLVLGVLGVSIIAFTHSAEHSQLSANSGTRAYYLAESGLRHAQEVFCSEGWLHGRERTLTLQGGEQVELVRIANNFVAVATANPGTAQQGRARVEMPLSLCGADPNAQPSDEFAVFGEIGIALGQRTLIEGDVAITDGEVDIRGYIDGSVLAQDVKMTGSGGGPNSEGSTVAGDIYSSGYVDITRGVVLGDVHSADGIAVTSAQSLVEGWLFSYGDIEIGGGATVLGEIHSCDGDVHVGGNGTSTAEIYATGDVHLSGTAVVHGEVQAGGSIYMSGSARIKGNAIARNSINIGNNNTIEGGQYIGENYLNPDKPFCPDLGDLEDLSLPDKTIFTAGSEDVIVPEGTDHYLEPGKYGHLEMPDNPEGDTRLYLNAGSGQHGEYYFKSIQFGGKTTLYLDMSGEHDIRIFVEGNIAIESQMTVFVSMDGDASTYYEITDPDLDPGVEPEVDPQVAARVYWESHEDFDLKSHSNWFGTVYTPEGNLRVGNTSFLIGSFYSGGGHNIIGSHIIHVAPNYFMENGSE